MRGQVRVLKSNIYMINVELGYKLRTHISKALQTRSQAVKNAVAKYNELCGVVKPSHPPLDPAKVLDYVYLSEFDLLRDSRYNIQEQ